MIESRLRTLMGVFLKLGLLGFGGPLATMGMMEEEFCRKRNWIKSERFTEMLAVTKLLPGPTATQMAIYIGKDTVSRLGGVLAGFLFVLPSFLIVLGLSALYLKMGSVPAALKCFSAMQQAALAVIALSVYQLSRPYQKSTQAWMVFAGSLILTLLFARAEPLIIFGFGILGILLTHLFINQSELHTFPAVAPKVLAQLFWVCFKSGAFVFGTGLAIVPMLEADVVGHYHWLTHPEFMDGLAIGQITPGPVVITATFIGYKVAGWWGAVISTTGIFFTAFFNILYLVPLFWEKRAHTPEAKAFTRYAIPAVIGAIAAAALKLGIGSIHDGKTLAYFLSAALMSCFLKVPAWVMIPVLGIVGFFL